jgi:hypothetical protein
MKTAHVSNGRRFGRKTFAVMQQQAIEALAAGQDISNFAAAFGMAKHRIAHAHQGNTTQLLKLEIGLRTL